MPDLMHQLPTCITKLRVLVLALLTATGTVFAADIDIYGPSGSGSASNAIFLLDNTSNWSSNNQGWEAGSSWAKCNDGIAGFTAKELQCQALITSIYYPGSAEKKPWESGYESNKNNVSLTQGQVQLRALRLVLNELVCANATNPISVNVGLAMIGDSGSVLSNGHSTGFIHSAVQRLRGPGSTSGTSCNNLINKLDTIDAVITSPTYKAPASANYGAAMYEIFKYFGGYADPTKASTGAAGTPTGATGYGPIRFSNINPLDDASAFTSSARSVYASPITALNSCSGNFMILVGNTYPNAEPSNGGPVVFNGLNYTPPTLPPTTSDTNRTADEWAYFLANADVSSELGTQSIKTYAINVYNAKPDTSQAKLLKSMAAQGGVGPAGYLEVGGDLAALVEAFKTVLTNIAAVDNVFTAATLPVSTTTQGTYLNQVFVGMFRPDANYRPRWQGNLKQYELGFTSGVLDLKDSTKKSALAQGFFAPEATSYWTEPSVFFNLKKLGTPESASDSPDGKIVRKGGAAQQLRKANLQNASSRTVYTILPSVSPALGTSLSATPFTYANVGTGYFSSNASWVNWIRGENNVSSGSGMEELNGSYTVNGTVTELPSTGARASIHGDVLHSRPIALNYGTDVNTGGVVVYYGSNDGFFRAVDGRKTGTTAGSELWSFIAPEFYSVSTDNLFDRLYRGTPLIKLPENSSNGSLIPPEEGKKPKPYGMDGPIGAYARYNADGSSLLEGIIFPTMRRGGNTVYAMNVTSKSDPKFLWKIKQDATYTKLGQTWSIPKPVVLRSSDPTPPFLLVMGGGYDPKEDGLIDTGTAISATDRIGNAIYIINGRTGALIKALPTDYSVPSDVTLVDVDRNGEIDRGYVADVRGNLYRFDFPNSGLDLTLASTWSAVTPEKIANLGGKVFFPPDVLVTKDFVAVMVGTGDREKPLQNTTSDNFFLIKDKVARTASGGTVVTLQKSDLTRVAKMSTDANTPVATNTVTPVNDAEGCYLELATNGEKVVNAPLTVSGVTYFGTNRPTPSNANQCSANLGQAYAYQFPLFCGVPPAPTKIDGGGLAPNPVAGVVLIEGADGKVRKVNFLIGGGGSGSNFTPVQPEPSTPAKRTRLYWKIDNANR